MSVESVMLSNHLILCCPLLLLHSIFPSIRVFSNELALPIRWPKYWSLASALVLPMNIQGWFPLGLTGLISLQSKGLSRVYSSTTIWKHQFVGTQSSWSFRWEDPLEKEMATHSSTLAWKIPWTEEPGRLQSMGSQRVGHDWVTSLSFPVFFMAQLSQMYEARSYSVESIYNYQTFKTISGRSVSSWYLVKMEVRVY